MEKTFVEIRNLPGNKQALYINGEFKKIITSEKNLNKQISKAKKQKQTSLELY